MEQWLLELVGHGGAVVVVVCVVEEERRMQSSDGRRRRAASLGYRRPFGADGKGEKGEAIMWGQCFARFACPALQIRAWWLSESPI